jgi:succinate-semialdehyde dehydrogenase/glutarate-semialdehyde dehydrogenase
LKNVLWYADAENAATLLADEDVKTEATKLYYPLSINFDNAMELSILSSYSLCSIINGRNTGVLKHASNVQGCAAIEDALLRQDFLEVFMNLNVESKRKTLIENKISRIVQDPRFLVASMVGQRKQ